jgi:deoxyribonuclease-4
MRLAAHTFGFVWRTDAEAAFEAIAAAGFAQVQLMATPPHFDPWSTDPARTARLRHILERSGMELLALDLASSDVNLASPRIASPRNAPEARARCLTLMFPCIICGGC